MTSKSQPERNLLMDSSARQLLADTLSAIGLEIADVDTLGNDDSNEIGETKKVSGIDSVVVYSAKDTVRFDMKEMKMRLRGDAKFDYKDQKLESEVIELDFKESTIHASGIKNTNGILLGYPKFNEAGEQYVGEDIRFNFKTKKGTIKLGETELSEGFYFGETIKRVSESEFFVENGYYTTCDSPDPHYHFGSPEMKMIANDRMLLDPLIFYVEDLPIFYLPVGLFFPTQGGRQSGLLVPSFFFSKNRGVVFEDIGLYWAVSDYFDTQVTADFYSKGGYIIKNKSNWSLKDVHSGNVELKYGKTRNDPDSEYSQDWSLRLNHNQKLNPSEQISANLNFLSSNFNANTSTNQLTRSLQNASSNASYSRSFDNGSSISLAFTREQNIITEDYTQSENASIRIPNIYPLKSFVSPNSWLRNVSFSLSSSARRSTRRTMQADSSIDFDDKFLVSHTPNISISPQLGFFNVSPSISVKANNYLRRVKKRFVPEDSSVSESIESGFFTEAWASYGLNIRTRLFGMIDDKHQLLGFIKPSLIGIKAFRHTWEPTLSFRYTPDYSNSAFYDTYTDENGREFRYSVFEKDGGAHAPSNLIQSVSYSDVQSFDIKIARGDSLEDKNVELMKLNFRTSYNFAADSLNFSDLTLGFRTPAIKFINFNGNATFTFYDQDIIRNETTGEPESLRKVNRFLIESGGGLAKLTRLSLNVNTSFSSDGISFDNQNLPPPADSPEDSISLGERFRIRDTDEYMEPDIFGDSTPGYLPLNVPWSVNLGLSYAYTRPVTIGREDNSRINLTARFSFSLTSTWNINSSAQYDFIQEELLNPSISLTKDMHCWDLSLQWYPIGFSRGFYLRFGIKASQLKDLMLEKRSAPIY